jgi:gamma-glutamylcyclotransferase (GGCT)/AIG2-like uncharacterized protein YtfP
MSTLTYFAYGSNLHPLRLQERVPSAKVLGAVTVTGRRLTFSKRGGDSSGKCDIPETGSKREVVYGVLYTMAAEQKAWLDKIEGKGFGYREAPIRLRLNGTFYTAFTYLAQPEHIDHSLAPYGWYKHLVLEGARYHSMPKQYVERLESIASIPDPDIVRNAENHARLASIRAYKL